MIDLGFIINKITKEETWTPIIRYFYFLFCVAEMFYIKNTNTGLYMFASDRVCFIMCCCV